MASKNPSDGGTLNLAGTWENDGTLLLGTGTLNLGGSFTSDDVVSFTRTGGTVNLTGRVTNTSTPLTLDGAATQDLLAQKGIVVKAGCTDPCALSATGSVTILGTENVFELTPATARLAARSRTFGNTLG